MEALTVAKKREESAPGAKPYYGPTIGIRGSREWKDWLQRLADSKRLKMADIIDLALTEYAEKYGFEPPPKR